MSTSSYSSLGSAQVNTSLSLIYHFFLITLRFAIKIVDISNLPLLQQQDGYVGFANLPNQVHRKSVKKGEERTHFVGWCKNMPPKKGGKEHTCVGAAD